MEIETVLISYLKEQTGTDVVMDTPLIDEGIIDSMGIMELLSFIEESFGVTPDEDDLTVENFTTISAITSFIEDKKAII